MFEQKRALKKRLSGKIAKIEGDRFEQILYPWAHRANAVLTRIPNGCKTIRTGLMIKLIRVKSPFDFIMTRYNEDCLRPEAVFFDAKSTIAEAFFWSAINQDQVQELLKIQAKGFNTGYLVHFRTHDKVVFFQASMLVKLRKRTGLTVDDGLQVGSLDELNLATLFF
jgi:hypothetical protein